MFMCSSLSLCLLELKCFRGSRCSGPECWLALCNIAGIGRTCGQMLYTLKRWLGLMWLDFLNCGEAVFQANPICHFMFEYFAL